MLLKCANALTVAPLNDARLEFEFIYPHQGQSLSASHLPLGAVPTLWP